MAKQQHPAVRPDTEQERIHQQLVHLGIRLPPASIVYTLAAPATQKHKQSIYMFALNKGGEIENISKFVADVLELQWNDEYGGITLSRYDSETVLVRALSYKLHGKFDRGEDAAIAGHKGEIFVPTSSQYRAGCSLQHRRL